MNYPAFVQAAKDGDAEARAPPEPASENVQESQWHHSTRHDCWGKLCGG